MGPLHFDIDPGKFFIAAYSLALMGEHMHPQVTLSCIAMGEWMPAFKRGDYEGVAEFMLRETQPIPWLHIAEEVAKAVVRDGYRHAALLGTRFTISGPVYPEMFEKHALKISTPAEIDQKIIDDIRCRHWILRAFSPVLRCVYAISP
jgi:hypothetical protein